MAGRADEFMRESDAFSWYLENDPGRKRKIGTSLEKRSTRSRRISQFGTWSSHATVMIVARRAGLHTGECELRGDDIGGLAVHIAARVNALAAPSQILVSSTIKDLVVGSGISFTEHGEHTLRGVPGGRPGIARGRGG